MALLFIIALVGLQFVFFYLSKKILVKKSDLKVKLTLIALFYFYAHKPSGVCLVRCQLFQAGDADQKRFPGVLSVDC